MSDVIKTYLDELNSAYLTDMAREHSHRPALKKLLESILDGVQVINEPKHIDNCAPDLVVTRKDISIGYIETKGIGNDLNHNSFKAQFDRYKKTFNNIIFTDYLNFCYYRNGELVKETRIGEIKGGEIAYLKNNAKDIDSLIRNFGNAKMLSITDPDVLAKIMALKAKSIAERILEILCSNPPNDDTFVEHKKTFSQILIHDISSKTFADVYAQTIAYGIFVASLYHSDNFSRANVAELIPQINPFLRKLFSAY